MVKQRTISEDPLFGEVVLPDRLRAYTADLPSLGALMKPNRPTANYVSRELGRVKLQIPSYAPYIAPDLSESPWPVPIAEHTAAMTRWRGSRQASKMDKHLQLPFTAWVLYRLRFISAADICGAWSSFGGLAAQLNGLSLVLNIDAMDNIQTVLIYDALLPNRLEALTRSRAERVHGATDSTSLLSTEQLPFLTLAASQADGAASKEKRPIKDVSKDKKKKKQPWVPRKE